MGRGIQRKTLAEGAAGPEILSPSVRLGRFCHERFGIQPAFFSGPGGVTPGYGSPTATNLMNQVLDTGKHLFFFTTNNTGATDSTLFVPVLTTDGYLDFGGDQELGHGYQINFGSYLQNGACPRNYLVGTDEFYARIKLLIEDVSGVDCYFGFFKAEAFAALIATYTDIAMLRILGDDSSAAGAISVVTNLNDATDPTTTAITSHSAADATAIELEVRVVGRSAQFLVNGAFVTPVPSFTADSGDYYAPLLFVQNTTDLVGEFKVVAFECGLLADRPDAAL